MDVLTEPIMNVITQKGKNFEYRLDDNDKWIMSGKCAKDMEFYIEGEIGWVSDEFIVENDEARKKIVGCFKDLSADLCISKTIPIPRVRIEFQTQSTRIDCDVCINPLKSENTYVGVVCLRFPTMPGVEVACLVGTLGNEFRLDRKIISTESGLNDELLWGFMDIAINSIEVWYGIQLLMLNPDYKEVMARGKVLKKKLNRSQITDKKRIVKYVKRHYITEKTLESEKQYNRHTLSWWVSGHYRQYKNKKVFIDGYWKGPCREQKKQSEKLRVRVLQKDGERYGRTV